MRGRSLEWRKRGSVLPSIANGGRGAATRAVVDGTQKPRAEGDDRQWKSICDLTTS